MIATTALIMSGIGAHAAPTWFSLPQSPTCHDGHAAAVGTNTSGVKRIYVIGGEGTTSVDAFDPIAGSWTTVAPMPGAPARANFAAATGGDGRIYVVGGYAQPGGQALNRVQAYDPRTNTWATVASLQTARYEAPAVAGGNGKIYVFGGVQSTAPYYLNSAEVYDPQANTWTSLPPIPGSAPYKAAAAYSECDNSIYLFDVIEPVKVYNIGTGTWSTRANFSTPLGPGCATGSDQKIYITGGDRDPHGYSAEVFVYTPVTDSRSSGPSMLTEQYHPATVALGDYVYVFQCQVAQAFGPLLPVSCPCTAPPPCGPAPCAGFIGSPIAYYRFDDPANRGKDYSTYGHNGTLGAAGIVDGVRSQAGVVFGKSLRFLPHNNVNEFSAGPSPDFNIAGAMTGMAWINPHGSHTDDSNPDDCIEGTIFSAGGNYWFQVEQDNLSLVFQNTGSGADVVRVLAPIPLDTWTHVAFTRSGDGKSVRYYVNGSYVGGGVLIEAPSSGSLLSVGNYGFNGPGDCEFNGDIDEIKIYNNCMSDQQIQNEYRFVHDALVYCLTGDCSAGGGGGGVPVPALSWPASIVLIVMVAASASLLILRRSA